MFRNSTLRIVARGILIIPLITILGPCIIFAAFAQGPLQEPVLFPRGVADPKRSIGYLTNSENGIEIAIRPARWATTLALAARQTASVGFQ